jgi:hypothetical protein
VSVLLRQPHGFECLHVIPEKPMPTILPLRKVLGQGLFKREAPQLDRGAHVGSAAGVVGSRVCL